MTILAIVGAATAEEDTAIREFIAAFIAGAYSDDHLDRLPRGREEVHVASDANDQQPAVIVIENGALRFEPLDRPLGSPGAGTTQ